MKFPSDFKIYVVLIPSHKACLQQICWSHWEFTASVQRSKHALPLNCQIEELSKQWTFNCDKNRGFRSCECLQLEIEDDRDLNFIIETVICRAAEVVDSLNKVVPVLITKVKFTYLKRIIFSDWGNMKWPIFDSQILHEVFFYLQLAVYRNRIQI